MESTESYEFKKFAEGLDGIFKRLKGQDYSKKYREANREKCNARIKASKQKNKLPYYIIYALPNFNNTNDVYCGITKNPKQRMQNHKDKKGIDVTGWYILDIADTKRKALVIESNYHLQGFKGKCKDGETSSVYRGIHWDKYRNKWSIQMAVEGKQRFVGYFDDEIEAREVFIYACELYDKGNSVEKVRDIIKGYNNNNIINKNNRYGTI